MQSGSMKWFTRSPRQQTFFVLAFLASMAGPDAAAQASVYRCLGNPVMYTSDQRLAQAKNCALAGGGESPNRPAPVRGRSADADAPRQSHAASGSVTKVASVDSANRSASPEQKARDSDRLVILTTELREEKAKLEALQQKLARAGNSGSASDDVGSDLSKAIARSRSDITALEREISRTH